MSALVCFTMDNLGDAADLHRGVIQAPRPPGQRPAFEQGYPALLELFGRFEINITHFVEGWSAQTYPEEIERVLSLGHSVGMHGWQHENWAELGDSRAAELAEQATEAIRRAGGIAPSAFRAPGGSRTEASTEVLRKLGYSIDSSLSPSRQDGGPVRQLSGELWTAPYTWGGVDATHWLWQQKDHDTTQQYWIDSLNQCATENSHMIFIWHPHVMGIDKARLKVGEAVLDFVCNDERFRTVTLAELIAHYQQA